MRVEWAQLMEEVHESIAEAGSAPERMQTVDDPRLASIEAVMASCSGASMNILFDDHLHRHSQKLPTGRKYGLPRD